MQRLDAFLPSIAQTARWVTRSRPYLRGSTSALALLFTVLAFRKAAVTWEKSGWSRRRGKTGECRTLATDVPESDCELASLGEAGRSAVFDRLHALLEDGSCCDVTLKVEGQAYKAHKCVLAAGSQPMRTMFESGFKEGRESVIGETLRLARGKHFRLVNDSAQ